MRILEAQINWKKKKKEMIMTLVLTESLQATWPMHTGILASQQTGISIFLFDRVSDMLRAILLDLGSNYHQGTLAFAIFLDLGSNYHQCDTYIFYSISMQRLVLD